MAKEALKTIDDVIECLNELSFEFDDETGIETFIIHKSARRPKEDSVKKIIENAKAIYDYVVDLEKQLHAISEKVSGDKDNIDPAHHTVFIDEKIFFEKRANHNNKVSEKILAKLSNLSEAYQKCPIDKKFRVKNNEGVETELKITPKLAVLESALNKYILEDEKKEEAIEFHKKFTIERNQDYFKSYIKHQIKEINRGDVDKLNLFLDTLKNENVLGPDESNEIENTFYEWSNQNIVTTIKNKIDLAGVAKGLESYKNTDTIEQVISAIDQHIKDSRKDISDKNKFNEFLAHIAENDKFSETVKSLSEHGIFIKGKSPLKTKKDYADIISFNLELLINNVTIIDEIQLQLKNFIKAHKDTLSPNKKSILEKDISWFEEQSRYLKSIQEPARLTLENTYSKTFENVYEHGKKQLTNLHNSFTMNRNFFSKLLNLFVYFFSIGKIKAVKPQSEEVLKSDLLEVEGEKLDIIEQQEKKLKDLKKLSGG